MYELLFNSILFQNSHVKNVKDIYRLILKFNPQDNLKITQAEPATRKMLCALLEPNAEMRFQNILPHAMMEMQ